MEEKILQTKKNGMTMLLLTLLGYVAAIIVFVLGGILLTAEHNVPGVILMVLSIVYGIVGIFLLCGLKVLKPEEALVLTLFGDYIGTLKGEGFYWVNPFCTSVNPAAGTVLSQSGDVQKMPVVQASREQDGKKISLKIMTLNNSRQKINDCLGNPVEIQKNVTEAGIEIIEARITYLAYAPEIAAVMLQRQQASAIIDARKMIVDGAVGMVEMALERLNENKVVELDDERKAAMVSNLLVVLCGNRDAQPIVNSGSLY